MELRRSAVVALLALTVGLGGCGGADDSSGPGESSVSEAKALDEAAQMIESRRPPEPVVSPTGPLPPSAATTDNNSYPPG
jgi:hypothetical protein